MNREEIIQGAAVNITNKKLVIKNCAPFSSFKMEINYTQVDYVQDINKVMPMYNLIENSNAYSKTSGSLRQYYKDEQTIPNNGDIIDFSANNNNSALLKLKQQITEKNRKQWNKKCWNNSSLKVSK